VSLGGTLCVSVCIHCLYITSLDNGQLDMDVACERPCVMCLSMWPILIDSSCTPFTFAHTTAWQRSLNNKSQAQKCLNRQKCQYTRPCVYLLGYVRDVCMSLCVSPYTWFGPYVCVSVCLVGHECGI